MINFNKHLKEILYEHDFIVLPQLGAFIADFSIDESGGSASPIKTFVFNNLLTSDENNKFFNFILSKETVPFSDIEIQWNEFVSVLKSRLNDGKRNEVPGIGFFTKNDSIGFDFNKEINFYSRDNFVDTTNANPTEADSISKIESSTNPKSEKEIQEPLPVVEESVNDSIQSSETTINDTFEKETIADVIDEPIADSYESDSFLEEVYEEEEKSRSFWWWLLPLLLIGGAAFTYWWTNRDTGAVEGQSDAETIVADSTNQENTSSPSEDTLSLSDIQEINTNDKDNSGSTNSNVKTASKGSFHVWAGLFRNKKNAEKLQQKLIKNSIPAEIQMVKNMRRVYVPVLNESEAQKMVKRIEQLTGDKAVYFEVD